MALSSDEGCGGDSPQQPPPRTDGRVIAVKMPTFTLWDGAFMAVSMVTFLADVGTDLHLVVLYMVAGLPVWAGLTLGLVLVPAVVVMVLSLRWHITDAHPVTKLYWLTHVCLWGIMHRYFLMFKTGLKARRTQAQADFDDLYRQQSDVCLLRLFESFLESAPQLVLQLYIMLTHHQYSVWTAATAFSSMASLGWGVAAYTKAMRNIRLDKHKMTWLGLGLQTVWRAGMIGARVAALAFGATILQGWLLLIMGFHLLGMFIWVVHQKAGFSKTKWEETLFNLIMAVVYCFCFFNLKEGQSRWRMAVFYLVIVKENIFLVCIYSSMSSHRMWLKLTCLTIVVGGMTTGLLCMVLYYRFFHPMGPLNPFKREGEEGESVRSVEEGAGDSQGKDWLQAHTRTHRQSFRANVKYLYPVASRASSCVLSAPGISLESSPTSSALDSPEASQPPPQQLQHKPSGAMCSVQDLLANVSSSSDAHFSLYDEAEEREATDDTSNNATGEGTEDQQAAQSSFERSITRELNYRLSSSDFRKNGEQGDLQHQVIPVGDRASEACKEKTETSPCHVNLPVNAISNVDTRKDCHSLEYEPRQTEVSGDISVTQEAIGVENTSQAGTKPSTNPRYNTLPVYSSPNCVGLPVKSNKHSSQTSLHSIAGNESQETCKSVLRTSVRRRGCATSHTDLQLTSLPHITTSPTDMTTRSQVFAEYDDEMDGLAKPHVPNVELAVVDQMHIIETESSGVSSESQSDYDPFVEGIADTVKRPLPPKPLHLLTQNLNETQTTQSSVAHDYENICAVNINREMLGVRHWMNYSNIADKIHDNSTYRERLKLLDSTLASSLLSESSLLKGIQSRRSISMIDDSDSVLSRSLPDLSSLRLETCLEEEEEEVAEAADKVEIEDNRLMEVLNQLRANRPMNKSSSVDNIPNYETIWVGEVDSDKPQTNEPSLMTSSTSKSSLVVTIGDVRAKESLCNLYYSTMSDLSFRYYSERMKKNYSHNSFTSQQSLRNVSREMMRAVSVPDNKTLLEVSKLIEEQKKLEEEQLGREDNNNKITGCTPAKSRISSYEAGTTPVNAGVSNPPRRKFSILRERFEYPGMKTPGKSPMKQRQSTQRRNSFQDRTAKALQAGMKVFRRPRVHVITPKKEDNKETPRLKSPFKSKTVTPTNHAIKINVDSTPKDNKLKGDKETVVIVQKTPQVNKTPVDRMLIKRTPKTSTPDETKQGAVRKVPSVAAQARGIKTTEGPKTSTPEGNKQAPQISILSAVSSVIPSPENSQQRLPLAEIMPSNIVSSKTLAVRVTDNKILHLSTSCNSVLMNNPPVSKGPTKYCGDENSGKVLYASPPNLQTSQSLLNLKSVQGSPRDNKRFMGSQSLHPAALALPQFSSEPVATIINVSETTDTTNNQQNVSISRIVLSSPQSPKFNMQKSTLSPNSKIFSRRI